jgi:hypothetical protein
MTQAELIELLDRILWIIVPVAIVLNVLAAIAVFALG